MQSLGENENILPFYTVISTFLRSFAPDDELQQGWWPVIGCSLKQFVAVQRKEYDLYIITQFFLHLPNCLYIKKSCEFLQSYGNFCYNTNFLQDFGRERMDFLQNFFSFFDGDSDYCCIFASVLWYYDKEPINEYAISEKYP